MELLSGSITVSKGLMIEEDGLRPYEDGLLGKIHSERKLNRITVRRLVSVNDILGQALFIVVRLSHINILFTCITRLVLTLKCFRPNAPDLSAFTYLR